MMSIKIEGNLEKDQFVAVWEEKLIIANEDEIKFLDISQLNCVEQDNTTKLIIDKCTNKLQYSNFQVAQIHQSQDSTIKIKAIHETKKGTDQTCCLFICEDTTIGKLKFFQLIQIKQNGQAIFKSLAPETKINQLQNQCSQILEFKSLFSYNSSDSSYHQVGIALRENLSVDFYFDFRNVETINSNEDEIFFGIDLSYRDIHFISMDKKNQEIKDYTQQVKWMERIGSTSESVIRRRRFKDLAKDYSEIIQFQTLRSNLSAEISMSWTSILEKEYKLYSSNQNNLDEKSAVKYAATYLEETNHGCQAIVSKYMQLYTSFMSTGRVLLISHNRFVSIFSLIKDKWQETHFDFQDQVRQIFRNKKQNSNEQNVGVLVGYKNFRFLEVEDQYHISLSSFELKLDDAVVNFVNDVEHKQAFYMVCQKSQRNDGHYANQIDKNTYIHIPFGKQERSQCIINVLYQNKIKELLKTQPQQESKFLNSKGSFKICLQKGGNQQAANTQFLVLDQRPTSNKQHTQLKLELIYTENDVSVQSKQEYELDYSEVESEKYNVTGEIITQISSQNKITQITSNHILIMEDAGNQRLIVKQLIQDRAICNLLYLENKYLYTIQSYFQSYNHKQKLANGAQNSRGIYVYDHEQLAGMQKFQAQKLDYALSQANSFLDFEEESQTISYIKDLDFLILIPTPHRNTLKFFGMGEKDDYILSHQYNGTFTALDKKSIMTMWSTATGKVLCSKEVELQQNQSDRGSSDFSNFQSYQANDEDVSWIGQLVHSEKFSRSLVISNQAVEVESNILENEFKSKSPFQSKNTVTKSCDQDQLIAAFRFKMLEMYVVEFGAQEDTLNKNKTISISYEGLPQKQNKEIFWKEQMDFIFTVPIDKEKRPFIYLSQDCQKMLVAYKDQFDPIIYALTKPSNGNKLSWKPKQRVHRYPALLKGMCSFNHLFSPNFERFIDYNFKKNQFVIKDTETEKVIQKIPSSLFSFALNGEKKQKDLIWQLGTRIMFHSQNEIRVLKDNQLDVIIKIEEKNGQMELDISSFVAVDNFDPDNFNDRNFFIEKADIPENDTFNRLIRKNAQIKQIIVHQQMQADQKTQKTVKNKAISDEAYQEIFSVDFQERDLSFSVNMSFTMLDWFFVQQLMNDKHFHLDSIEPKHAIQLCFNIFPRFTTLFHMIAKAASLTEKNQKCLEEIFGNALKGELNEGQSLTLPIIQDERLMTPIDLCLSEAYLNVDLATILLSQTKDYPLLHSSFLLQSAICKAIEHKIPCIAEFLEARIIPLQTKHHVQHQDKEEQKKIHFDDLQLLEPVNVLQKQIFGGLEVNKKQKNYYFDIPQINDFSEKSNQFFVSLSESEDLDLFVTQSIQAIVKKAWKEQQTFFIFFLTVPYCILTIAYFIWSNFAIVEKETILFHSKESQELCGIVTFIIIAVVWSFFVLIEIYRFSSSPLKYIKSANFWENFVIYVSIIAPSNWMRDLRFCKGEPDRCEDGIPDFESIHTTNFMYYADAFTNVTLWLTLFYYLKMFTKLSYLVRTVWIVLRDLVSFVFLLFIASIGFSGAFYQQSEYNEKYALEHEREYLENYISSFIYSFYYFQVHEGELNRCNSALGFILFIMCMIFIYLVLSFMLITVVAKTYEKTKEDEQQYIVKERATLVRDCRQFPFLQQIYWNNQRNLQKIKNK